MSKIEPVAKAPKEKGSPTTSPGIGKKKEFPAASAVVKLKVAQNIRGAVQAFHSAGDRAAERKEYQRISQEKAFASNLSHSGSLTDAVHAAAPRKKKGGWRVLLSLARGDTTIVPDRSDRLQRWRLFIVLLVLVNIVAIPYYYAFKQEAVPLLLQLSDIFLLLDVLINFRVAYVERGIVITEPRAIVARYAVGWLWLDLFAALSLCGVADYYLPLLCFSRFWKIPAVINYYSRWAIYTQLPSLFRLVRLGLSIFVSIHLIACAYVVLSRREGFGASPYLLSEQFDEGGERYDSIYLYSFYWSSSLLLSNPLAVSRPDTQAEVIFQFALDLLSVVIFATTVGEASTIISELGSMAKEHQQKMTAISYFLGARKIPPGLTRRIMNYFDYLWSRQQGMDDQEILDELPRHLRTECLLFLYRDLLKRVAFFQDCEDNFFATLAAFLRPQIYSPNDYVITFGDVGEEMFFLARGVVEVVNREGVAVATLTSGSYFGEIALVTTENRTASVRAVSYCDILSLSKEHFDYVLSKFPKEGEIIKRVASDRLLKDKKTRLLRKLPLLENASAEFTDALLSSLDSVTFDAGDYIVRAGEMGTDMFFIGRGFVDVLDQDGALLTSLSDPSFFGEIALIFKEPRSASVRATSKTECFRLSRPAFERVLAKFPDEITQIQKVAAERKARPSASPSTPRATDEPSTP